MLPAIHIFGIHVPLYGLMMVLGGIAYAVMFFIITKREKVDGISRNRMLFFSILGAVVLYASAFVFDALFHSIEQGKLVAGGITWLGGIVGLVPFMLIIFHKWVPAARGDALYYLSMIIPGIVLGHAFGRLGCFFGGCCYGKVTDSVFGVIFPEGSSAAQQYPGPDGRSLPVLPTQLFEAAFELVLFIVLISTRKKTKRFHAEIYLLAYGVFRFGLEFLRGDDRGSTGFFLSPAQVFCILLVVFGILMTLYECGITAGKLKAKRAMWRAQAAEDVERAEAERRHGEGARSLDTLDKLFALKEKGAISEEEYEKKKEEIMHQL